MHEPLDTLCMKIFLLRSIPSKGFFQFLRVSSVAMDGMNEDNEYFHSIALYRFLWGRLNEANFCPRNSKRMDLRSDLPKFLYEYFSHSLFIFSLIKIILYFFRISVTVQSIPSLASNILSVWVFSITLCMRRVSSNIRLINSCVSVI